MNILDNFKVVRLVLKHGVFIQDIQDTVLIACANLIEFDLIGGYFNIDGNSFFIPWSNIVSIENMEV